MVDEKTDSAALQQYITLFSTSIQQDAKKHHFSIFDALGIVE